MKIHLKKIAIQKKGWSLYRLAKELCIPQQTVYSWATARTQPSYENIDALCDILECTVDELFEPEPITRDQAEYIKYLESRLQELQNKDEQL